MRARFAIVVLATLGGMPRAAHADSKQECAEAYEQAQVLRLDGKLTGAREAALRCAQSSCPKAAKVDCARWLGEIEASLPTIVVEARDASGRDVRDVRVLVDGKPLTDELDGSALPLDPGVHKLRYESTVGVVEQTITVRQGEKNRKIVVELTASSVPSQPPPPKPQASSPRQTDEPSRQVSPMVYVLGGVGVVALGAFGYFGVRSWSEWRDMKDGCAKQHACDPSEVDSLETKQRAADISLGVAIVALGAATILYVSSPSGESRRPAQTGVGLRAAPTRGGGRLAIEARF